MEKKLSTVKAIVDCAGLTERDKLFNIKSYLLGWTSDETALRIVESNGFMTAATVRAYAEAQGKESAANLVLLSGPDSFRSIAEYETILVEMEGEDE